jgi:glycerol kinase
MRSLTIIGPFAEVGKEEYAHTPYSQIYLVPAITGLFKAM